MLRKAAAIKRFEYSPLSSEVRKQTSVAEEQYQKLDKVFEQKEKDRRSRAKSNIVYNKCYNFLSIPQH